MNKTWLITKTEYLKRVRKRTFILTTILTPLVFAGFIAAVVFITVGNIRKEKVAVVDPNGLFRNGLQSGDIVAYDFRGDVDTGNFVKRGYSGLLLAPHTGINTADNFQLITEKSPSRFASEKIKNDVSRTLENNMISRDLKIDPQRIDSIKKSADHIKIDPVRKSELGQGKKSSFDAASAIGYVTAFLIYITLFIYGMMVMRGVMEEKTNRIAEVMVSSVKPFQMMLGKIIGIGAVGLTQFLIWIILLAGMGMIATSMLSHEVLQQVGSAQTGMSGTSQQAAQAAQTLSDHSTVLTMVNWPLLVGCFIFYFLGGFLFYASLFAAIGSAVNEDAQDAQSLTLPVTMPIILSIIIMINSINDPSGPLATWSSIIPFSSPIVMMSRIPFGVPDTVPYWQLGLSMLLLVAGFLFTTWLSAKIYRTGILMYGKKPTWKEMIKWVRK